MTRDFEESTAFWETVGVRAKYSTLEVGDLLLMEDHRFGSFRRRPIVITSHDVSDDGHHHLGFRDATPEEAVSMPERPDVLVAGE